MLRLGVSDRVSG